MYPNDFPIPQDTGGPGAGQPLGGFGGNPAVDRAAHRAVVAERGKAPVLLVHGNGGAADVRPWDMLDQRRFLLAAGYAEELIWAPSYLGGGGVDLLTPHTNNVDDIGNFLEAVCAYLDVQVVDVVAHSLGCTLTYALLRGLASRQNPPSWDRPKKWSRVGALVSLAGAFHGLGAGSIGEWQTGAEFMTELLQETDGGGGETPFGAGRPQTPGPVPHTINYFCGIAAGDFVDAQQPGTGQLEGAENRSYNLGSGTQGHQAIKENQAVFNDFLPLLNPVPPAPAVTVQVEPGSGEHSVPLTVTVQVDPAELTVSVLAELVVSSFQAGYLVQEIAETNSATLQSGESISLPTPGRWKVAASAPGSTPVRRSYWVDVPSITVTIVTDNSAPFDTDLLVRATSTDPTATLYHSLDWASTPPANGSTGRASWNIGATVTITEDCTVAFVAINPQGVASAIVSRAFSKRIPWDDAQTADAIGHFLAGRIEVQQYLAYSDQFGYFTPFTLYLVDGRWVLDPNEPASGGPTPTAVNAPGAKAQPGSGAPVIRLVADSPLPGRYPLGDSDNAFAIVIEAAVEAAIDAEIDGGGGGAGEGADHPNPADQVTVHYTRDGSLPTTASPSFSGAAGAASARFEFLEPGNHVLACRAVGGAGRTAYRAFAYTLAAD